MNDTRRYIKFSFFDKASFALTVPNDNKYNNNTAKNNIIVGRQKKPKNKGNSKPITKPRGTKWRTERERNSPV